MNITNVGVVGAGVMGRGVAHALAQAGFAVSLVDVSDEVLSNAKRQITRNLKFGRLFKSDAAAGNLNSVVDKITFTKDYDVLGAAEFVIENVNEKWPLKQSVYYRLEKVCPPHTIFAANTSAIRISHIAAETQRPAQVIGMHFMNPVPMKPTVEVIRTPQTSAQTIEAAASLLRQMNKGYVLVNDSPGFVSNRVLMVTINESISLLDEDVASAEQIDRIFRECFGHKMGPLETADLIGLDTILDSLEVLSNSFGDDKYQPSRLLKQMVEAGRLGRKSGHGFYPYELKEQ
ncbi:MAG: 3-hydroxybutyryl-CoA dehydrogenase [Acidobacteriota bacterium]|jgi:3-hydroxybutyryl-CoA dehydrogenase